MASRPKTPRWYLAGMPIMPRASFLAFLLLAACGSSTSEPAHADADVAAREPAGETEGVSFHFFSDRGGARREVTEIVYSDRFTTVVEGLPQGAEVTLTTRMYAPSAKGRGYTSKVVFLTGDDGRIDTSTMAPIRGSYTDVDPDGILWSMTEGELEEGLYEDRGAAIFSASVEGAVVAAAALGRLLTTADVEVTPVTTNGLVAELFMPKDAVDRVPVVALGGSEGGIWSGETFAMRLASLGHPTLALAYFGMEGLPSQLDDIPLEYFEKAFTWLEQQPGLRKGKVVVLGVSRGGELALQLGATFPNVAAVIAEAPSSVRWAGLAEDRSAAWTFEGKALPFMPEASGDPLVASVEGPGGKTAWALRPMFEARMTSASPAELAAARIAVENTQGPVLMLSGADDQMWPACEFAASALTRLQETGHHAKYGDESVCYPEAGHSIGSIGLPATDSMWAPIGASMYALGGTARGNARAGRQTDERIRAFLDRVAR